MKEDEVFLCHITDAIVRIESYVSVGRDVFLETPHWQDAVIRQLEVIGEAAKRISQELEYAIRRSRGVASLVFVTS